MTAKELLTAVRVAQCIPSNYRLASLLGIREGAVTRWNSGRGAPDDSMAARLAELAGLDPDSVVAAMYALRAHDAADRARWERIAQRLSTSAAVVFAAVLSVWFGGDPDGGAALGQGLAAALPFVTSPSIHCHSLALLLAGSALASLLFWIKPAGDAPIWAR